MEHLPKDLSYTINQGAESTTGDNAIQDQLNSDRRSDQNAGILRMRKQEHEQILNIRNAAQSRGSHRQQEARPTRVAGDSSLKSQPARGRLSQVQQYTI